MHNNSHLLRVSLVVVFLAAALVSCGPKGVSRVAPKPINVNLVGNIGCPPSLALATDTFTYDAGTLAQMSQYVNQVASGNLGAPPPSLDWADVADLSAPYTFTLGNGLASACGTPILQALQLTNIGPSPITIVSAGLRYTAVPVVNQQHYRLISWCSFLPPEECQQGAYGQAGQCSIYDLDFRLHDARQGTIISATPSAQGCPALTLAPKQTAGLAVEIDSTGHPAYLTYRALLQLTVSSGGRQATIDEPQVGTTFTFAGSNQFTCYILRNNTFVPTVLDPGTFSCTYST